MKRFIAILLCAIWLLYSCKSSPDFEYGKLRDTFFSEEWLGDHNATNFPIPNLEGSYLDESRGALYLDLSREEYELYVRELIEYLRTKEGLTVTGYMYGTDIMGLFMIPIKEYLFAPLDDEHINYTADSHTLVFSSESIEESYGSEVVNLKAENTVNILWNPTEFENSDAHYTVELQFLDLALVEYYPCHHGHSLTSLTYPIPGSEQTLITESCDVCGLERQNFYPHVDRKKWYTVNVTEGAEYVINDMRKGAYSGTIIEINTSVICDADIRITANGTEIPMTHYDSDYWGYYFVMPEDNVEVTIEIVGGM